MRIIIDLRLSRTPGIDFAALACSSQPGCGLAATNVNDEYCLIVDASNTSDVLSHWKGPSTPWNRDSVHIVGMSAQNFFSWHYHHELHRTLRRYGTDVYHFPTQAGLAFLPGIRSVVTVHDLVHLAFPETYLRHTGMMYQAQMRLRSASLRRADRIVAISDHTKADVIRFPWFDQQVVDFVYNRVNSSSSLVRRKPNPCSHAQTPASGWFSCMWEASRTKEHRPSIRCVRRT